VYVVLAATFTGTTTHSRLF